MKGAGRYWVVVSVLCLFGIIGIFTVGMPFLLLGVTLAAVAPWRSRRAALWPAVTAVVAFVVGYVLVAPLGCSTTASEGPQPYPGPPPEIPAPKTTCTNLLGIDYSGTGAYNPSPLPALLAGLALSLLAAVTVAVIATRRERRRPGP